MILSSFVTLGHTDSSTKSFRYAKTISSHSFWIFFCVTLWLVGNVGAASETLESAVHNANDEHKFVNEEEQAPSPERVFGEQEVMS
jgi:hypothetical protein